MGLRCLLGHEFGEREVERERREAGDEVVVVYRTVENCRRCGDRRIVSENKEVRSIDTGAGEDAPPSAGDDRDTRASTDDPTRTDGRRDETPEATEATDGAGEDPVADGPTDGEATAGTGAEGGSAAAGGLIEAAEAVGTPGTGGTDDGEGDAVIITGESGTADTSDGSGTGVESGTNPGAETEAEASPGTDLGPGSDDGMAPEGGVELLDDADPEDAEDAAAGDGAADGGDADADGADDGWPAPSPGVEDEGYDATPHEDTGTDVEFGGGFAPTPEEGAGAGTGSAAEGGVEPAFVRASDGSVAARDADGPTELCCPNCGATRTASGSSLRGGDICPECRKGYVAERAAEE